MEDEKLFTLNKQGLIPGPDESEEAFQTRALYCLNLKETIKTELRENLPFPPEDSYPESLEDAIQHTKKQYDLSPHWIPLFFSNAGLTPWHGGCAWIFQTDEHSPTSAFLQLRKQFHSSERYLGLYDRREILSHELAHVGRMAFEEHKFEEFLAYRTSPSPLRRWLGPLVQSTWESLLFVGILIMIFIVDLFLVWYGDFAAYQTLMWLKGIPLALIGFGLIRLIVRHRQLSRCEKKLKKILPNPLVLNAVIYRLTDEEIINFGKLPEKEVFEYIENQEERSLRWRAIKRGYFDGAFQKHRQRSIPHT